MTFFLIFALGLLVGFIGGVVSRDAWELLSTNAKESSMTRKVSVDRTTVTRRVSVGALIAVVLLQLAVGLLLIQSRATNEQTARDLTAYTKCSTEWQQEFATAYRARLAVSVEVSDATDRIITAVASQDRAKVVAAFQSYLKVRDKQVSERAQSPLPELPKTLCGLPPVNKP